jgi:hypothetical protein
MPTAAIKNPKIDRVSIKAWEKGTVTAFDDGRTPTDGLRASGNVLLDQDGTVRPRPSLVRYGTQPTGTILGEMFEFIKANGTLNEVWLCTMQNVAGTTNIYVNKDGGAWTLCTGKTYDNAASAHFCQIDNKILIMNGVDNLSYLDIPTLTVIPFVALGAMSAPTAVNTGLTGSVYTYYYRVSANSSFGETAASTQLTVTTSARRETWGSTAYETLSWTAPTGATANTTYNVYIGVVQGSEFLIAAGVQGLSFKDDGTLAQNPGRQAPPGDTTAGPTVTRGSVINGQAFLYGDTANQRTIYFGGTSKTSKLDFSPFNGGGTLEIGRGTKEIPVKVMSFRDGKGNAQTTVLCRGTNGTGKRFLLTPSTQTVGTTIINFFTVTEDNGNDGTDSPDAVILYNDSLWYPSRDGFKTTGTKPQLQNLLSTDTVSETIITDIPSLNNKYMANAVGLAYQRRLYFAVPNGTTYNNEIWILDLARGGAWMKPWNINVSWMTLYNDNAGLSHHLVLSNNVIYEFSRSQFCNDDGTPFATNATSGLIKFSDDGLVWSKVIDVTFILLRPQGTINFTVAGKTEDSNLVTVGSSSVTFDTSSSVAGWGEAGWGGSPDAMAPEQPQIFGWSNFSVVPVLFGNAQSLTTLEIDEELEWITWEIDSNAIGADYQIADVIARKVDVGIKDLT